MLLKTITAGQIELFSRTVKEQSCIEKAFTGWVGNIAKPAKRWTVTNHLSQVVKSWKALDWGLRGGLEFR